MLSCILLLLTCGGAPVAVGIGNKVARSHVEVGSGSSLVRREANIGAKVARDHAEVSSDGSLVYTGATPFSRERFLDAEKEKDGAVCDMFELAEKSGSSTSLSPRPVPARLIDTFAFGNIFEHEELLLRMYEMGNAVDEIHIVEGDREFTGEPKDTVLDKLLLESKFDPWREKITHHRASIPAGITGYALQNFQRKAMHDEMHAFQQYDPKDVILEGDLDEIVSKRTLKALRHCTPNTGDWNTGIRMGNYYFSMAWTSGDWGSPTAAVFKSELGSGLGQNSTAADKDSTSLLEAATGAGQIWARANLLRMRDNSPSGWHFAWTLDGPAGIAHKIFIHTEGKPDWAQAYSDESSLAKFLEASVLPNPGLFQSSLRPSLLSEDDVPQALVEHPEKFPNILRGVHFVNPKHHES
eukprot:gnl/TRDRNA2_/TRDRNA2_190466_c0_seq1.p1 gnl/TRDRNA2_/TRDRNA2_190466_c0~~gnl/TRDRNA2_/TRDRNA2_190466_c0_seq1.p1  ORF type:complete len:411 (-),score=45.77 gnl/TRDRNA2_/TRDRNA2_190466_c0_seq1:135-1367(-)